MKLLRTSKDTIQKKVNLSFILKQFCFYSQKNTFDVFQFVFDQKDFPFLSDITVYQELIQFLILNFILDVYNFVQKTLINLFNKF
ncbi:hypothetical protein M153_5160002829 [Pseudoloma neurophilia]|uniref:Uncharacterized protein n=1 Tax=Pseudoloma neurophilia TaxID=146866 RepID=A0A0R0M321_9MICR|nr:hypothetical protein M153_5160002829 [Pseudoloma neurophilia]